MRADTPPARADRDLRIRRDTLHLTGAFLVNRSLNLGKSRIGPQARHFVVSSHVSHPKINSLPQQPG
jgi:hypothetical protein